MSHFHSRIEQSVQEVHRWMRLHCATAQTNLHATFRKANTALQSSEVDPKHLLYGILAILTLVWTTALLARRLLSRKRPISGPATPDLEKRSPFKAPAREPGSTFSPSLPPRSSLCPQIDLHMSAQYGHHPPSNAPPHPPTPTGPSYTPNPFPTALTATAPNTTSRWASAPCTGTIGSSSTTIT